MARSKQQQKQKERLAKLEQQVAATRIPQPPPTQMRGAMVQTEFRYSGILPLPDHLQAYEALAPGITERFMGLAERQSKHRQGLERIFMWFNGWSQIAGVLFGGLIALSAIAAGTFLIYHEKNVEGFTAMLGPLSILAGVFYATRHSWRREAARKQQAEQG